jgi:NSS family neurotransmitter:Na+ symporter
MFTLSIGFGTMVTFGSYLKEKSFLPMTGFRVCTLDCLISLAAGVMIFPLVIYGNISTAGPELLFQAVPTLFSDIPSGEVFGIGFFLCLYLASLGASIGLLETIVANLRETRRVRRSRGALGAAGLALLIALFPALSSNVLRSVKWGERGLLEILDAALINWILPITALLISQVVYWFLRDDLKKAEFEDVGGHGPLLYKHWNFVLKYAAPGIILVALFMQTLALF